MSVQVVRPERRQSVLVPVAVAVVLAVGLLWWAKWAPYAGKARALVGHGWSGSSLLEAADVRPGSGPSLAAGLRFTHAYGLAVWKALVAALLISAAVQSLVPRAWLVGALSRRTRTGSAVLGGLLGLPSMMCTCCTAPVACALRRSGAPTAGVVAYWLGNPLLNPAVLVFLALVAPWEWFATRLGVGLLLVVAGSALVARLTATEVVPVEQPELEPQHFPAALLRTAVVLVPEYLLVVLLVGTFSGWLFPLASDARSWIVLAVLVAVVLGTCRPRGRSR